MADYKLSSKGSCVPVNKVAFFVYKNIQKEINRFLDKANKTLLTCDGKIGEKTLVAINRVKSMYPTTGVLGTTISSCTKVAENPASYYLALSTIANQNNLNVVACPDSIIRRILSPSPKINPDGDLAYPNWKTAGVGGIPFWAMLLLGGGSYYYLYGGGKKKTRKSLTR